MRSADGVGTYSASGSLHAQRKLSLLGILGFARCHGSEMKTGRGYEAHCANEISQTGNLHLVRLFAPRCSCSALETMRLCANYSSQTCRLHLVRLFAPRCSCSALETMRLCANYSSQTCRLHLVRLFAPRCSCSALETMRLSQL